MQNTPKNNYIELKVNRDFGDIITTYFEFFKINIKKFTNIFLSYNGIFLVVFLIISYLLVSGFIGLITDENNSFFTGTGSSDETYWVYIAAGGLLLFFTFIIVAVFNFSLSSSYMVRYEERKGQGFEKTDVWALVKENLGNTIVFILLLILLYIGLMILSVILAFIPLIGMFAQYIITYFLAAWAGVSFICMIQEKKGVTDAMGEGWNLVTKNFWKSVGVNFILGLLNGILMLIVLTIPGILIGIYTFHVVENNVAVSESVVPTIIYTLGTCVFLILGAYAQCLSQFVNGILYYALHEKAYNINTRSKIDQIGTFEQ
ncbi:hypothetical protein [Costertonia aggregata]|uniref:Glycerophosphoryl diester phosphodiesterase membrane domain-containing protein n=1 Tax=Costertonia aggregata TaxID=343403 RepID=A0A7H9ASV0_9FLAO|nr:hypothetical protein [Costertonia aggregata]QLG46422.1 hypothetical protein HYG79_14050 [Costertonia aggregata]